MNKDKKNSEKHIFIFHILKPICFFIILSLLFVFSCNLFQPVWTSWHNYETTHGIYNEPEDTVSVIFLGASITATGFIPMELYRDYGICSYNFGTEQQPVLASYYWLQETYRLHSDTLKVVFFDASMLRRTPDISFFKKSLDGMDESYIKINAVCEYSDDLNDFLSNIIPIFSYHDRWDALNENDYTFLNKGIDDYSKGYCFSSKRYIDDNSYNKLMVPAYYADEKAEDAILDDMSLTYFDEMARFCRAHHIKLVIVRTPAISNWSSDAHNAVTKLAENYRLEFFDFCYEPLISELDYNNAIDSIDGEHTNYYGAHKLTAWFGNYLMERKLVPDVRGNEKYAFMEEQLESYNDNIMANVMYDQIADPAEYIKTASSDYDNVVFITDRDDAAYKLTTDQREMFADYGLTGLSELTFRGNYYAVIDSGKIIVEHMTEDCGEEQSYDISSDKLSYSGTLSDGATYTIIGGGHNYGDTSSCIIDDKEYSQNKRGLNIIIYNKRLHKVIDSTTFDTYTYSTRETGNLDYALEQALSAGEDINNLPDAYQKLYLYNQRCTMSRNATRLKLMLSDDSAYQFIEAYTRLDNAVIYISVKDDITKGMDVDSRDAFRSLGLIGLSSLKYNDSYVGIIDSGRVTYELTGHNQELVGIQEIGYALSSGESAMGVVSIINILDKDYSPNETGLNIVVCDKTDMSVIDVRSFDVCTNGISAVPLDFTWENQ